MSLAGIGLSHWATSLPAYTNPEEKLRWDREAGDHISTLDWEKFKEKYFDAVGNLKTRRNEWMDLGMGIASLSVTGLLFSLFFRIRRLRDFSGLRSPRRKWVFFAAANIALCALLPSTILRVGISADRGDYPWFADSLAIPILGCIFAIIFLLPCNCSGLSRFPLSLWERVGVRVLEWAVWKSARRV